MRIALTAGHTLTGKGTGAIGYVNESRENRELARLVKKWLEKAGAIVFYGEIDKADDYLAKQVVVANKQAVDVAVQIHFNANKTTNSPMGTETFYSSNSGKVYADRVNIKLANSFKSRGAKKRTDLYWLNNTKAAAVLIEVCFVDSKADVDIYKNNKDKIAKQVAEGILGKAISEENKSDTQEKKTYYQVVVGSYTDRVNADKTIKELREKGYSPFIDIELK